MRLVPDTTSDAVGDYSALKSKLPKMENSPEPPISLENAPSCAESERYNQYLRTLKLKLEVELLRHKKRLALEDNGDNKWFFIGLFSGMGLAMLVFQIFSFLHK